MRVLVIDVGGSSVKLLVSGRRRRRKFESGEFLTPKHLLEGVRVSCKDWKWDVISLGLPANIGPDGPKDEPGNLGKGWVGYDFESRFGCPVRIVNDAAMQALGAYSGERRMLFLGLGTGLGSTLIANRVVMPLELGCLPFPGSRNGETLFHRLGKAGLKEHGKKAWRQAVHAACKHLREAMAADDVVIGGGNAKKLNELPKGVRRGGNKDAFTGGFRLWEEHIEPHDRPASSTWRVVA